jgi:hypothetical protein
LVPARSASERSDMESEDAPCVVGEVGVVREGGEE